MIASILAISLLIFLMQAFSLIFLQNHQGLKIKGINYVLSTLFAILFILLHQLSSNYAYQFLGFLTLFFFWNYVKQWKRGKEKKKKTWKNLIQFYLEKGYLILNGVLFQISAYLMITESYYELFILPFILLFAFLTGRLLFNKKRLFDGKKSINYQLKTISATNTVYS